MTALVPLAQKSCAHGKQQVAGFGKGIFMNTEQLTFIFKLALEGHQALDDGVAFKFFGRLCLFFYFDQWEYLTFI